MNQADENSNASGSVSGIWRGVIEFDVAIPIELCIEGSGSELTGMSNFPQHRRADIPLRELSFTNGILRFSTHSFGEYAGELSTDALKIVGAFSKEDKCYPLTLRFGEVEFSKPVRPQTPRAPFPYDIENIVVENSAEHYRLAGTLTIPHNGEISAVALLITGSGAMDRDESIFGHKLFWVLADYLSRRGYAVLRMDDRGVGESTGDRCAITIENEADDVSLTLDYLQKRNDFQSLPLGLIGHSMGGVVGMMVAARRPEIEFLIAMASPGLTVGDAFAERECQSLEKQGKSKDLILRHRKFTQALYRELAERPVEHQIDGDQITAIIERFGAEKTALVQNSQEWIARLNQPWFRSAVRLVPVAILKQIHAPLLAINGSRDIQTTAQSNLEAIRLTLAASRHSDFETIKLENLNHLFQTCVSGEFYEYPTLEESFAPVALDAIGSWLDKRFRQAGLDAEAKRRAEFDQ